MLLTDISYALRVSLQQALHHALDDRHDVGIGRLGFLPLYQVRHFGVDVDAGGGVELLLQRRDDDALALLQLRRHRGDVALLADQLLQIVRDRALERRRRRTEAGRGRVVEGRGRQLREQEVRARVVAGRRRRRGGGDRQFRGVGDGGP